MIATALLRLAERDPSPELYVALPLVKPGIFVPWEFVVLHKRLKAALATQKLPVKSVKIIMAESDVELKELVRKYQEGIGPETGEKSAGYHLRELGDAAVPVILEAYEAAREGSQKQRGYVFSLRPLVRLADLLSQIGDPRATAVLIELARIGDEFVLENPLLFFIPKLERRGDAAAIVALVEILKAFRHARPKLTILIAQTLIRMAERNPVQELAAALPYLHSGLRAPAAPMEFSALRKRLKAVLPLTNLPLAAAAPQTTQNLPRPAEDEKEA